MESAPLGVREPLIAQADTACVECWCCVRCCPVRAIRVIGGRTEIVQEKCVACGLCVSECEHGGFAVRDDTGDVRELLRTRRHVVALLASEFIAALYPMTVSQVQRALDSLGFSSVETTLLGEEIVAAAYESLHSRGDSMLSLRSTCPVAVDFVRKYHPAFAKALAPIVPPYIAQARLIREVYPEDVAIVYVSPCYARKDEFADPELAGAVDAVIDFTELKMLLIEERSPVPGSTAITPPPGRPSALKEISLTDGFPRQTLVSRDLTDSSVSVVRGLAEIDRLLRAIAAGEAGPRIIDLLSCEGCIDGPAVSPGLSLYAKRNIEAAARRAPGTTRVSTRAMLGVLPAVETLRTFEAACVVTPVPDASCIDAVLAEGGLTRETAPDCGACGWATCVAHATAVYNAESTWDLCLPLQKHRLAAQDALLAEARTLDELTGVWNHRSFSDRLAIELARLQRYGSSLCVLLIDVDGLGAINDTYSRAGGDAVLLEIAGRLSGRLRTTDLVARWTGDRFAVILPGIGKTEAFAVAEKLREAVRDTPVELGVDGYTGPVDVSVAIGAAAAAPAADVRDLLVAADSALLEAMRAGGDQVRLAPG